MTIGSGKKYKLKMYFIYSGLWDLKNMLFNVYTYT